MGDCDYSVPSNGIACPLSGGRIELESALANSLVPTRNSILILSGLRRWIKNMNMNKIRKKTEGCPINDPLNGRRRNVPGPML
jgi:hypothetical protein